MRRLLATILLCVPAGCGPLPVLNDPSSTDFFGMDVGLVRTYRAHFPICGKPHDHYMRKSVLKELPLAEGKAVIVEIRFNESNAVHFHGLPAYSREVFTETNAGFGYYGLEGDEQPGSAEPKRIEVEVPKPATPGTRMKFELGEVIIETREEVVVGAGRFADCIRIRTQFKDDANVFWFAPGVGMVRGYSEKKGKDGRPAMEFELLMLTRPSR